MSNYSNTFNGAGKDAAQSTIFGSDFDTQFDAIASMSATKADKVGSATSGNVAGLDATGNLVDSGYSFPNVSGAVTPTTSEINQLAGIGTVWGSNTDGAGSGLDADTVDAYQASALLSRANHTGTQTMSTISDAGALATRNTVGTSQIDNGAITPGKVAITGITAGQTGAIESYTFTQVGYLTYVSPSTGRDDTANRASYLRLNGVNIWNFNNGPFRGFLPSTGSNISINDDPGSGAFDYYYEIMNTD